jgi:hypothetical protein
LAQSLGLNSTQADLQMAGVLNDPQLPGGGPFRIEAITNGTSNTMVMATFLTGRQARKTGGADLRVGVSVDQLAAAHVGRATRFPSLEVGCEGGRDGGGCDHGYSCLSDEPVLAHGIHAGPERSRSTSRVRAALWRPACPQRRCGPRPSRA